MFPPSPRQEGRGLCDPGLSRVMPPTTVVGEKVA